MRYVRNWVRKYADMELFNAIEESFVKKEKSQSKKAQKVPNLAKIA